MERLTNIGSNGEIWITDNDKTRRLGRKESAYKRLAEYEDAEEKGLLLKLPCKVGDRLYKIDYEYLGNIISDTVHSIHILRNTVYLEMKYYHDISLSEVGKTTFLTQAEAEQKLKEMESESE